MPNLKLSLACGDYDRTRAILDGKIRPEGIDLTYIPLPPTETFWRMLRYNEFDISEMSLSNYLTESCKENMRFIAIPVFPSRMFRHGYIFINRRSGIKAPADLKQKKVGIAEYSMTATVWMRGILQHDYGVAPSDMEWYLGGREGLGRQDKMVIKLPDNLHFHQVPVEKPLSDMLANREIDAILAPIVPPCFREKHPDVERLFPNYKEVEMEYYSKTRIFPIMHTVVIKQEIYDANPWVAQSMYKAFSEAKKLCQDAIGFNRGALTYMLPWTDAEYESTTSLMGEDFWPYGVEANKVTLRTLIEYSYEQGLSSRKLSAAELFAANTQTVQVQEILHK